MTRMCFESPYLQEAGDGSKTDKGGSWEINFLGGGEIKVQEARGNPRKVGWGCAACFSKPLPYL